MVGALASVQQSPGSHAYALRARVGNSVFPSVGEAAEVSSRLVLKLFSFGGGCFGDPQQMCRGGVCLGREFKLRRVKIVSVV